MPTAIQLERATKVLERRDLDALVVWSRQSLRHLAGLYLPHLGFLPEEYVFLVCTRAGDQVVVASYALAPDYASRSGIQTVNWEFKTDPWATLTAELRRLGVHRGRIGVELEKITVDELRRCESALPDASWHEVDHDLMLARQLKTPAEVALIDEAAKAGERAMAAAVERGAVGMTDRQFALELRVASLREGVDELSWLALNWNSFNQRMHPTDVPIGHGEVFSIEMGLAVDGYYCDLQRTVGVGAVSEDILSTYRQLMGVHQRTIDSMVPGCRVAEMHRRFDSDMTENGLTMWDWWLGHSLGLDVHEGGTIWLSGEVDTVFEEGMVFAVEPVVTTPALLAIEDDVVIEASGPRLLSGQLDWSELVLLGEGVPTRASEA
ncbi:Xaa-Pro peptidase family protein [Nocardioides sp. HM23]|uniref:M24 family metallopeptidase n=1 Tax=Nocardioides bizhenqiangii TaxID=3095076 RepID=UPI002ACA0A6B|nr:Xaa-Pro peptidase family protein [Nocardioides sp. HM23]MDZ5621096.1 Xaa-Pro peptidase family protein [Nocardioides sp. HM23]